jgi:hypothetical protein
MLCESGRGLATGMILMNAVAKYHRNGAAVFIAFLPTFP